MTGHAVPVPVAPPGKPRPPKVRTRPAAALFEPSILRRAVRGAFAKLDPRTMIRNPVMFVVEIGSVITTVEFFARPEATPEQKLALIRREQRGGHMVAMTGDGTNDASALAQADVGLAMNTGTQAAKEAGNMVDLDSNPTKLIEVVEVAKQLLITRGSLTTFSIANDVAKYFAIIPAMFVVVYPRLQVLNVMHLDNPHTAILAAVIYNALIFPALIPFALRGVRFRPRDGTAILRRNGLIYGVGGIIAPFAFIKLLDLLLAAIGLH